MRRYIRESAIRPQADWLDAEPFKPSLTVYEPDTTPRFTGLYDKDGTRLFAVAERAPIGFWRTNQ